MKRIEVLIKPYQLDEVKRALHAQGLLPGITATELSAYTRGVAERMLYRGTEQIVDLLPRMKLEIVAHDDLVNRIVAVLVRTVGTGRSDDGEIAIGPVSEAVRIRTGEIDEAAIA